MNGEALVVFWPSRLDQYLTLQVHYSQELPKKSLKFYESN